MSRSEECGASGGNSDGLDELLPFCAACNEREFGDSRQPCRRFDASAIRFARRRAR